MRAREFLMKDAYSFHIDDASLQAEYRNMYDTYGRIFTRLGLAFRAVFADTGAIGGSASHEFQVLADSGEDAIAFSDGSDYAANIELAEAVAPGVRPAAGEAMRKVATPVQKTCEDVAALLGIPLQRTVKSVAVMGSDADGNDRFVLALVRGDHSVNEIKLAKVEGLGQYRMATEAEILAHLGSEPGFLGPVAPKRAVHVVADRSVAAMADFVVGANEAGFHLAGVNWGRDLPEPAVVADIRNVVAGDPSPDGKGTLQMARGIEVGHVFALGDRYSKAMACTVLDAGGKPVHPLMGCYGIGISRIVAAAIEQNHDAAGIVWPEAMAPWQVVVCVINPKDDPAVAEAAEALYRDLRATGLDVALDDRGLRTGQMLADIELIGIPHRVVVSGRGLEAGTFEYRARTASESTNLDRAALLARLSA
jgi:prolyl-tRNA synthetase